MVDKTTHDDYIKLYKELVDRVIQKEEIIELMTKYIANFATNNYNICSDDKKEQCNHDKCEKCVRDYFEKRGSKN